MTVNKAQGQTIPNVGVYLPAPVFSHGQLYVAMSRATSRTNIKILALPADAEAQEADARKEKKGKGKGKGKNNKENGKISKVKTKEPTTDQRGTYTKNIVYKEVLTL